MDIEEVVCNLCGVTEFIPLYTFSAMNCGLPAEFVLRRCLGCGLMYLSPRPTSKAIAGHYPAEYDSYRPAVEDEQSPLMRWIRRRKLAKRRHLVEQYSGQMQGRLLDVGCATGLFLHEMAHAGWQVEGIEPIASAAEYARCRFSLSVFQGTLSEAPYEPASFDVVTFWDVLEHTFFPADELAHAACLLREGGLLVVSAPNWDSPDRWLFGRHWLGLDPPRHMYVFTRETLARFLTRAGFSVLGRECFVSGYFSFAISLGRWLETMDPRLSKSITRVLSFPGMRFPFEPWFAVSNWLRKGAIICVLARKTSW